MKTHLLSRVRNEADIITDSVNHWREFTTGKLVIYDDCSTDLTPDILSATEGVDLIRGTHHHKDRDFANYWCREQALKEIRKVAAPGDWVVCADADERIEFDWQSLATLPKHINAIAIRLFDYYITPEDAGKGWKARTWIGPEYRDIVMIWRHHPSIKYDQPSQRIPTILDRREIQSGYCHHYGKARSVEAWETKCKYYQGHFSAQPLMQSKWKHREGKAIKADYRSDFKYPLIKWSERSEKGIPLTAEVHKREFA